MEKVERTQYQAALVITGTWQGSSRTRLYEELGWESLSDRRWSRRIFQIQFTSKKYYHHFVEPCIELLI